MKLNSRIMLVLSLVFVFAIMMAATSASDLNNKNFKINVPADSDFTKKANTNLNIGNVAMDMLIFENQGKNSNDISTIVYMNGSSSDKIVVNGGSIDLKKDYEQIEENKNYTVYKTQSDSSNLNIGGIEDIFNFTSNSFTNNGDDIFNISSGNNHVSISDKGLEISDENGEMVTISSDGINISDNASSDDENELEDTNVDISGDINSDFADGDYIIYLEDGNQMLILSGNNLNLLKDTADSVSFK